MRFRFHLGAGNINVYILFIPKLICLWLQVKEDEFLREVSSWLALNFKILASKMSHATYDACVRLRVV